ncbi:MAG: DUF488 family protein [Bacteroidales bacterium]|nr:DUF488 family protein [Bacteroidales bacterium]
MTNIKIKRVYLAPEPLPGDGYRIFIDRLWPRGESKQEFHYDLWDKDVAPSVGLREWFHADPLNRWDAFAKKYIEELEALPAARDLARIVSRHDTVTLLYGSRDTLHNNAIVLRDFLDKIVNGKETK